MSHTKVIVTTTINPPTEALIKYANIKGWHLVAVGDLKTPIPFHIEGATYLSPEDQEKIAPRLSELIGWNCIQRRNIGFIWAIRQGASVIATVDDDNIPYEDWGMNCLVGKDVNISFYESSIPAFDPISVTEHKNLWHRGFPIQWLTQRNLVTKNQKNSHIDVEAGFWNGDPDIDAVCRMEHGPQVTFSESSFPFSGGPMVPFNSQNTILSAKAIREYFLFPKIGRMDDIWAAYWLQSKGFQVAFAKASVFQKRNEHDLTKDFNLELIGHQNSHLLIEDLQKNGPDAIWNYLPEGSQLIFKEYQHALSA